MNNEKPRSPNVMLFVVLVVIGMIGLKIIQSQFQLTTKSQPPGTDRGDITVANSCLPDTTNEWKKAKFTPPAAETPKGQYWWTHSWIYSTESTQAIVAFDQANWVGWHELSECYSSSGWTLESREIHEHESDDWNYVVSKFSKAPGLSGVLVFSLFFEDGKPIKPWELSVREIVKQNMTGLDRLFERSRHTSDHNNLRALQCQVFVPVQDSLSDSVIEDAIQLHLETRQSFVQNWMTAHKEHQPK